MTVFNNIKVDVDTWLKSLEEVQDSHQMDNGVPRLHKYIASDSQSYSALEKSGLDKLPNKFVKIPLSLLVTTSDDVIKELDGNFIAGSIDYAEYEEKTKKIVSLTKEVIQYRIDRRQSFPMPLLRLVGYVISAAASVFLLGIPFILMLQRDRKFQKEVTTWQNNMDRAFMKMHGASFKKTNPPSPKVQTQVQPQTLVQTPPQTGGIGKIEKKLNASPAIPSETLKKEIKEIISEVIGKANTKEELKRVLQAYQDDDLKSYEDSYDPGFDGDMIRESSFMRNDKGLSIKDDMAQPPFLDFSIIPQNLTQEEKNKKTEEIKTQRITKGIELVEGLLIKENDDRKKTWKRVICGVLSQRSVLCMFSEFKHSFGLKTLEKDLKQWVDTEGEHEVNLKFPEHFPPIHLNVIRHRKGGNIKKIEISTTGFYNIVKTTKKDGNKNEEILFPKAIEGNLSYSIGLDKKGKPWVSRKSVTSSLKSVV